MIRVENTHLGPQGSALTNGGNNTNSYQTRWVIRFKLLSDTTPHVNVWSLSLFTDVAPILTQIQSRGYAAFQCVKLKRWH